MYIGHHQGNGVAWGYVMCQVFAGVYLPIFIRGWIGIFMANLEIFAKRREKKLESIVKFGVPHNFEGVS